MEGIAALWFDGRTSRARPVRVQLAPGPQGPSLSLRADDGEALQLPHRQVGWPERWSAGRAPRKLAVDLREHGSLEVEDIAGWEAALVRSGHRPPLAQRMQTHWPVFIGVLLAAGLLIFAFYRWGTPWAATQLTRYVPTQWETELAERFLRDLDGQLLKPSKLPPERQAQLRARFDELTRQVTPELRRYPDYRPSLTLHLRAGLGENAFALPGGTIVLTDGMVAAAAKHGLPDDALVGVLAHEIGHVMYRHTTRMVVEQAVLNVGFGLAMGDVSTLVSMGGSLLTGLAYRRSHETESDCFAVALMRRAGLQTQPMADLLLKVDGAPENAESSGMLSLISSHPDTPQRARDLKSGQALACS